MRIAASGFGSCKSERAFFYLLCAMLFAAPAVFFAQGYFGTVSGELTDPTGAVVQGAKVTLSDQQKGYQFTTSSDKS